MPDLMLFPPSWYAGPPDPPEPIDDGLPEDDETCRHGEPFDCEICEARPW